MSVPDKVPDDDDDDDNIIIIIRRRRRGHHHNHHHHHYDDDDDDDDNDKVDGYDNNAKTQNGDETNTSTQIGVFVSSVK
ncbi:hypothetical protein PoB_000954000 [Plakobranchus ocellatus]|uniref:Uncharacterized protein n=1 Tax=Plakobranchus ocellatus TaxID=259542 RepID=A0AAV3YKM1_9GAST|nr:hypothetical protein PoB_000954000 [Plakobranchus ocellatus]